MEEKDIKKNHNKDSKELNDPNKIKGKIFVPDNRERRDGPGGN